MGPSLTPYRDVPTLSHMSLADFAACVLSPYANKKRANVSNNRLSLHQTPTYAVLVSASLLHKKKTNLFFSSLALIFTQKR